MKNELNDLIEYGMKYKGDSFANKFKMHFNDMTCHIEKNHPHWYQTILVDLHEDAYGSELTKEIAEKIVKNKFDEHWTIEKTETVNRNKANMYKYYIAMNKAYHYFYYDKYTIEDYIRLATQILDMYGDDDTVFIKMLY